MKQFITSIFLVLAAGVTFAAGPLSLTDELAPLSDVPVLTIQALDRNALLSEDAARESQPGVAPRFAVPQPVSITTDRFGRWESTPDGLHVWRYRIAAERALSINLGFSQFRLPRSAKLYLFGENGKYQIRPFTAADNKPHGELWTPIVRGDSLVLELVVAESERERVELEVASVNYGYRGFFEPAGPRSGACNVDVVCPEGDDWPSQISSVAVISTGGGTFCSGFMVNNVRSDGTPYFMTADHCGIGPGNAASLVTYWNYQNSTCRTPGSGASGGPGDGTLDQFNTGSTFRAARSASDFVLVEMDNPPDPAWNVGFAGWDARDVITDSAIAIHHPNTDEKRISFEFEPTSITSYLSNISDPNATHIRVEDWDVGTTEGGSSGSPLFSPEGRVIGQLHGGFAACGNDDADWYGRMAVSWDTGTTSASRLRDWLDPDNTGTLVIDALGESAFAIEPESSSIAQCGFDDVMINLDISEIGGLPDPVSLTTDGLPAGVTELFSTNPVTPPDSSTLTLGNLSAAGAGLLDFNIVGVSGDLTETVSITIALADGAPDAPVLSAPADGAIGVNTNPTISWGSIASAASYDLEIATDSAFNNLVYSASEPSTSHRVASALDPNSEHFVRVRAVNACDSGNWSAAVSFTTASLVCTAPALAIPDGPAAGVATDLVINAEERIDSIEVSLDIEHDWVGDLLISLEHVESETIIELVDRTDGDGSFGCDANNIRTTVSDDAPLSLQTDCNRGPNNEAFPEAAYRPNDQLSTFSGLPFAGTWRLFVRDQASTFTGTVNEWCILSTPLVPLIFEDRFEDSDP